MNPSVFRSEQRGGANHGWLLAKHSFSFADWYEPSRMGFGVLRVINEDRVAPKTGFSTHGHRDMEILTYILGGALAAVLVLTVMRRNEPEPIWEALPGQPSPAQTSSPRPAGSASSAQAEPDQRRPPLSLAAA